MPFLLSLRTETENLQSSSGWDHRGLVGMLPILHRTAVKSSSTHALESGSSMSEPSAALLLLALMILLFFPVE